MDIMNITHKLKRVTALLLTVFIIFSQTGCTLDWFGKNVPWTKLSSEEGLSEFDDFTNSLFCEIASSNTITLHSLIQKPENYNILDYDVTLGSYNTEDLDGTSSLIECINSLKSFDTALLSPTQQITYEQLLKYFETELEYSDLYMFFTSLSPTTGVQVSLPIVYAEYSFSCEKDVQDYLELLSQTDRYFNEMLEFETLRSNDGIFMEDTIADQIIDQCQIFVDGADDGYLISTFDERINTVEGLSDEQRSKYKSTNAEAVKNHVIPAYCNLITGIKNLKGTNKYPGGLCNSPNGKKYYEYLLKSELGWSKTIEELDALLDTYMSDAFMQMNRIMKKSPTLLDKADEFSFKMTEPKEILSDLKTRIKNDFPDPPDINYEIKYVNKSLEDYSSPAMYFLPQIDNITDNVIYINNKTTDISSLYATLAHEGYPGHMYQSTYFAASNPSPIRTLLRPSGYLEGWASYCELYSYNLENSESPELNELMRANFEVILLMYSKVDIGVNYYGWTENDTAAFLSGYGFTDKNIAHEIYYAMVAEPGNYPNYSLGCVAFLEMRKTAETILGNKFNAKEFHTFLMDLGPVQFDIVNEQLQIWAKKNLAGM